MSSSRTRSCTCWKTFSAGDRGQLVRTLSTFAPDSILDLREKDNVARGYCDGQVFDDNWKLEKQNEGKKKHILQHGKCETITSLKGNRIFMGEQTALCHAGICMPTSYLQVYV